MLSTMILKQRSFLASSYGATLFVPHAFVHHHKERGKLERFIGLRRSNPQKANRNTHTNERRFRTLRAKKVLQIELPDFELERKRKSMTPTEIRVAMLNKGINVYEDVSPRIWKEQQISLCCTPQIIDNETITARFMGENVPTYDRLKSKMMMHPLLNAKSLRILRKIQGFQDFKKSNFAHEADQIFKEAHEALMNRDVEALHATVTESAFPKMWRDVERGSIRWEILETIEPTKVIAIRAIDVPLESGNYFAQITVKMHSKQKLAVFDRFGRLILGSEETPIPVLEYLVFENHVIHEDGRWRLHDKLIPSQSIRKQPSRLTFKFDENYDPYQ